MSQATYVPAGAGVQFIPPPFPAASNPYASYSVAASPQVIPGGGNNPDFHAVLDNFVRSTGLTPAGSLPTDQEAAASSFHKTGDTPVFSFKKLYSFPFYLSSDNVPGFALNIPYMKRHIRRMSSSSSSSPSSSPAVKAANANSLKNTMQMHHDQQKLMKALHSSEMIANYLQSYLRKQESSMRNNNNNNHINSIHDKSSMMMMMMPPMTSMTPVTAMTPPPSLPHLHHHHQQQQLATLATGNSGSKISNSVRQQQNHRPHRIPSPESQSQQQRHRERLGEQPEPEASSFLSNFYSHHPSSGSTEQYYAWNPEAPLSSPASSSHSTQDQLYQRLAQLEDLRRRRTQVSVSSADELLADQLNSRVVVDDAAVGQQQLSSSTSPARSTVERHHSQSQSQPQSSLQESLSELQTLSNGLRSMSAPSSLLDERPRLEGSRLQDYSSSMEDLAEGGSLSAQESSYRPSIVTYYPDPSLSDEKTMRASVTDVMPSGSSSIKRSDSTPRAVVMSSSYSMSGSGSPSPPSSPTSSSF
jgi:hypothetical protein